jgi:hypothetical protein
VKRVSNDFAAWGARLECDITRCLTVYAGAAHKMTAVNTVR